MSKGHKLWDIAWSVHRSLQIYNIKCYDAEFHRRGLLSGVTADCLWGVDCPVSVCREDFKD